MLNVNLIYIHLDLKYLHYLKIVLTIKKKKELSDLIFF